MQLQHNFLATKSKTCKQRRSTRGDAPAADRATRERTAESILIPPHAVLWVDTLQGSGKHRQRSKKHTTARFGVGEDGAIYISSDHHIQNFYMLKCSARYLCDDFFFFCFFLACLSRSWGGERACMSETSRIRHRTRA